MFYFCADESSAESSLLISSELSSPDVEAFSALVSVFLAGDLAFFFGLSASLEFEAGITQIRTVSQEIIGEYAV